nr:aldehyde dehydrogenase family protein [Microbacterium barkeri]
MTDYAVINPATGETLASFDTFTDAQIEEAVAAADEAHREWSRSTTPGTAARASGGSCCRRSGSGPRTARSDRPGSSTA